MIRSILVANRGEIARRVFRTARDLGIETVAVHSDADANAPFVGEADRAVRLPGNSPADTYLRGDLIIAAAQAAGADAIHPGYGFLSENADFARKVAAAGLTWIGPSPDTIDSMGSKIEAKKLMKAAGVPILEVDPESASADDFPLLVKASAGGGGRGMRVVERAEDLQSELDKASAEAQSAFGDGTVFVEPYLPTARHVEVQVLADSHGTVWILGDRDCSIQRRHQKVVEEAPAPGLTEGTRKVLHDAARAAAQAVDYVGAGTVEFMVDEPSGGGQRVFFLEMNTRLQVEHPVTEEIFGVDLVALQIAVAEGSELGEEPTTINGHAVEVRLYAEDPTADYAPQTGVLREFDVPLGAGVRVDSAVETGSEVGIHYDAMIAKVIAHGPDRTTALRTLDGALRRARIHGLITNRDLLRAIITDDEFVAGRVHTALLDGRIAAWTAAGPDAGPAVVAAAVASAVHAAQSSKVLGRIPTGYRNVRSQPRVRRFTRPGCDDELVVSYITQRGQFVVDDYDVVEASASRVVLERGGVRSTYQVTVGAVVDVSGPESTFSFIPLPTFVDPSDAVAAGSLLAPMPASVTTVAVEAGQQVAKGDVILVLEAMKMQHTITSPADGVVAELNVSTGTQVESGAVLAVISTHEEAQENAS